MSKVIPNEAVASDGDELVESAEERRKRLNREKRQRYFDRNREKVLERNKVYKAKYRENGVSNTDTDYYMRSKYGISLDDYNRMLAEQNGGCAVCGVEPTKRRHHIDHDHETGAVRGLLCHQCNLALGCVSDDPDRLLALAAYLLSRVDLLSVTSRDVPVLGGTQ